MTITSLFRLLALAAVSACAFAQAPAKPETPAPSAAQQSAPSAEPKKEEPKYDMGVVRLTLAKRAESTDPNRHAIAKEHLDYWMKLMRSGTALAVGAFEQHPQWSGFTVLRVVDSEADKVVADDPAVKAGLLTVEGHKWFTARNLFKPPKEPVTWRTYYFGFITRGEKWTPEVTEQTKELQRGHMANIQRLADMGKLIIAGPIGGDGPWRGIFIFDTPTIEEARQLSATDPAVIAGRLKIDIYPLQVPEGVLPEVKKK